MNGLNSGDARSSRSFEGLAEQREFRRRADTIIARLTQAKAALASRVPEFEAPDRGPGGSEGAGAGPVKDDAPEERQKTTERSWWRRVFGP